MSLPRFFFIDYEICIIFAVFIFSAYILYKLIYLLQHFLYNGSAPRAARKSLISVTR